ncbi:MAG: hypothetical protein IT372_39790 [Polyangiaceae bacterium]|nr:hypothetical protein [Polyangiaceae bacterium]
MGALGALAGIAGSALIAGCPGTLDDKEKFLSAGACPDIPTLFAQTCLGGGCHSAASKAGDLDLESPELAARVSGAPSTGDCAGRGVLADPADPEGSVLYFKLEPSPPCGSPMPPSGAPLTEAQLACVREWIASLEATGAGGAGGAGGSTGTGTGGAGGM